MIKSCSCFGKTKDIHKAGLAESVFVFYEYLIQEQGFNVFYFGGVGEFDEICFNAILKLKEKYHNIKTVLVLPQNSVVSKSLKKKHVGKFDGTIVAESNEIRLPILSRNTFVANSSDFILFYASESGRGGDTKILNFAKEKNIPFMNFY